MPETYNLITALCAGIGRGHANYLDSVLSFLSNCPRLTPQGWAWTIIRQLYRLGGKGGFITLIYNQLRQLARTPKLAALILDSGLKKRFCNFAGVVLVDHPLLAQLLAPVCRVIYLHGEIAAPPSAAIPNAWGFLIPLEYTARRLKNYGIPPEKLLVTGLILEPQLLPVAETAFHNRLRRYHSDHRLAVAFFTSGAYPQPHLKAIRAGVISCKKAGHRVFIFAGTDSRAARHLQGAMVFATRTEENNKTAQLLPEIDLMVAAAHERVNWAVGIGLPMFALLPHIGPFARENFEFAQQQGVCLPLSQPERLGDLISELRPKELATMAQAGWNRYPLNGAQNAARILMAKIQELSLDQ